MPYVADGAQVLAPAKDEFYGDHTAKIEDPVGHVWSLQTKMEKLSPKAIQRRLDDMMSGAAAATPAKPNRSKKKS